MARPSLLAGLALLLIGLACPLPSQAQAPGRILQVGPALVPGVGVQGGFVLPRGFYTLEGILSTNVSPRFAGGEGSVLVSGGFGGALRILDIAETFGSGVYPGYALDFGLRLGPSLDFILEGATEAEKNTLFELFLESYLRLAGPFSKEHNFFVELGTHRPLIRGGLWLEF